MENITLTSIDYSVDQLVRQHHKKQGKGILSLKSGFYFDLMTVLLCLSFNSYQYFRLEPSDIPNLLDYDSKIQGVLFTGDTVILQPIAVMQYHDRLPLINPPEHSKEFIECKLIFNLYVTLEPNTKRSRDSFKVLKTELIPSLIARMNSTQFYNKDKKQRGTGEHYEKSLKRSIKALEKLDSTIKWKSRNLVSV